MSGGAGFLPSTVSVFFTIHTFFFQHPKVKVISEIARFPLTFRCGGPTLLRISDENQTHSGKQALRYIM